MAYEIIVGAVAAILVLLAINQLGRLRAVAGESRSYLAGMDRGRVWAEDMADYIEIKEWSETEVKGPEDTVLPHGEETHFHIISAEAPLEWQAYVRGWLKGVKEVFEKY
jgi:hypothetical protein